MTCRVEHNDNTSLQWSNPAQQTLFFGDKKGKTKPLCFTLSHSPCEIAVFRLKVAAKDTPQAEVCHCSKTERWKLAKGTFLIDGKGFIFYFIDICY